MQFGSTVYGWCYIVFKLYLEMGRSVVEEFKQGQKIKIKSGGYASIVKKLGQGGQGIVYEVDYAGKRYALKWYQYNKIKNPTKFRNNLENNIKDGNVSDKFLWPKYITEGMQYGSFGYIMDLRKEEYKTFPDILNAKVSFGNLYAIVNAALDLTSSFRELHRAGKSYQDLNDGGFFINPKNGNVLICDCDNVAPYGESLGIAGKPGYMAPEVVRGKATPSVQTDKFSLAIVLFKLLLRGDPLEGEKVLKSVCLTEEVERYHYGTDPVFVYDPDNDQNRPVRGVHNNVIKFWRIFPEYIREAFITSFTKGLKDSNERLIENQWLRLFIRLRSEIIQCNCGNQNFLSGFLDRGDGKIICLRCNSSYTHPLKLDIKKYPVILFLGVKLYKCHTEIDSDDYNEVTGEVIQNKLNPGLLGIRNLSNGIWNVRFPDGTLKSIDNGKVVPILKDIEIDFGNGHIVNINE